MPKTWFYLSQSTELDWTIFLQETTRQNLIPIHQFVRATVNDIWYLEQGQCAWEITQ